MKLKHMANFSAKEVVVELSDVFFLSLDEI